MITSLYIHIPFCIKKCIYCDFFSIPYDEALALRYVSAVMKELELRKDVIGGITTIFIGGGTPTMLPTPALVKLFKKTRDLFTIIPDAEITIEANPKTVTMESAQALHDSGINRFSIGIQSFNDAELTMLGRVHTAEDALTAIASVRGSGVPNLSLDLIYGIPGQTRESWSQTVRQALELSPEHLSLYELTPENNTPLYGLISEGRVRKPDEETILGMYNRALDRLIAAGYRHYEISNCALPGFECRHNINYWNRGQYVGIGAGAHSFIVDRRIRNISDVGKYIEFLADGLLPIEESSEVLCNDALKEFVFLGLRKMEGLDIMTFREDLDLDIVKASEKLVAQGLLLSDGTGVRLTRAGIAVSNTVITELFRELGL